MVQNYRLYTILKFDFFFNSICLKNIHLTVSFFFKHKKIGSDIITHTHLQYVSTKCYGYVMLEHML